MKDRIYNIFGNNFICKLFFVLIPFLNEIPVLTPYFNPMMKFGLILGAVYILLDLFHERNILKTPCIVPAILLIVCVGIGSLMHYQAEQFKMNLIEIAYTIVSLLVLYPAQGKEKAYKELTAINYLVVTIVTVASMISVYLFFARISISYSFNETTYCLGVYNGRLVGVFRNSIYPTAAIATFSAAIQLFLNKTVLEKKRCWQNKLLIISMVLNTEVFILQASRGIFISFAATLFVFFFFIVFRFFNQKQALQSPLLRGGASVVPAAISVGVGYGLLLLIQKINFWISAMIEYIKNIFEKKVETVEQVTEATKDFTERVMDDRYGLLTGRPYVWKTGLLKALEQPLFGYGPYTLANEVHPYEGSTEKLSHFHNIFVQTLVSGGICGLIAFVTLTLCCVCRLIKTLFTQLTRKDYMPFLTICVMLVFIFIVNMADTTILFMTKHSGFIFFIYLGYAMALCNAEKGFKMDFPAQWLDSLLSKRNKSR